MAGLLVIGELFVNHPFRIVFVLFIQGGGPFTFSSQQETVVHDLSTDDKDYISVAEEVMKSSKKRPV